MSDFVGSGDFFGDQESAGRFRAKAQLRSDIIVSTRNDLSLDNYVMSIESFPPSPSEEVNVESFLPETPSGSTITITPDKEEKKSPRNEAAKRSGKKRSAEEAFNNQQPKDLEEERARWELENKALRIKSKQDDNKIALLMGENQIVKDVNKTLVDANNSLKDRLQQSEKSKNDLKEQLHDLKEQLRQSEEHEDLLEVIVEELIGPK